MWRAFHVRWYRPRITKLTLKQNLVSLFLLVHTFSFDKMIFSIFQVSKDHERWLTASVRHFTLCGILLERLFSWKSESFTGAHVRDYTLVWSLSYIFHMHTFKQALLNPRIAFTTNVLWCFECFVVYLITNLYMSRQLIFFEVMG